MRDGTNRRNRLVPALDPLYAPVDDRDIADLLLYARRCARLIRYYGTDNESSGDWTVFFDNDVTTLVALIRSTDPHVYLDRFTEAREALDEADDDERPDAFSDLFLPIFNIALLFDNWYRGSVDGLSLRPALERLIGSDLSDALAEAGGAAARVNDNGPALKLNAPSLNASRFDDVWSLSDFVPDQSFFPTLDADAELEASVARLQSIFDVFYEALLYLVDRSEGYLDETLDRHPAHRPHMVLFLAFLKLFRHAKDHLNTITRRHLEFYYRDVLKLDYRPEEPDSVHLIFELARNVSGDAYDVPADTVAKAGKDDTGIDLFFATDDDIVINRAAVDSEAGLKSLYIEKDSAAAVCNIYAAPDADSSDGEGADIEESDGKWATFGGTSMPFAEIGFAVASPSFLLGEGERTIGLVFTVDGLDGYAEASEIEELENALRDHVIVEATGEKGWIRVDDVDVEVDSDARTLTYTLTIPARETSITPFDPEVHGVDLATEFPAVRFILDNSSCVNGEESEPCYPYRYFNDLRLEKLDTEVTVSGMRTLLLENDQGVLNPAKPFMPFGSVPKVGSGFYIGSSEIFAKALEELTLHITWGDLPTENFGTYYAAYTGSGIDGNDYFTVDAENLIDGTWTAVEGDSGDTPIPLFNDGAEEKSAFPGLGSIRGGEISSGPDIVVASGDADRVAVGGIDPAPSDSRTISLRMSMSADPELEAFTKYSSALQRGFIRMTLNEEFGHRSYATCLASYVADPDSFPAPNQAYTPLITGLTVDYKTSGSIDFTAEASTEFVERFFHIHPFGFEEFSPADDPVLVPRFEVTGSDENGNVSTTTAEGTLYIGLSQLDPPCNLSMLFQVSEGSADPTLEAQEVVWSMLIDNRWQDFEDQEILSDTTNGLLTSGILTFSMPKEINDSHTILDDGLYWIKASVAANSAAVARLIAVLPQAVKASYRNNGNDPNRLAAPLAAESIGKLKNRPAAVKTVRQPYASFGGRTAEGSEAPESSVPSPLAEESEGQSWSADFHTRVSERLRHKRRGIALFDYERLVLENFPELYKVKCLTHTSGDSEYAPGHVTLTVVPDLRNRNAVDPLQPMATLNTLETVDSFLRPLISDFIELEVKNPDYEQICVAFDVAFNEGIDAGYYTTLLSHDIVLFLSPWLDDAGADLAFGKGVHRSTILNFVEERTYVDYVRNFRMDHVAGETTYEDVEEAIPTTSSAVLVSAESHAISHIRTSQCPTTPTLS